jgi:hypothetical protein
MLTGGWLAGGVIGDITVTVALLGAYAGVKSWWSP